jgi:transcriptional regulator with XRE-family HTH domain
MPRPVDKSEESAPRQHAGMPTTIRRRDSGIHHADATRHRLAYELRIARAASGLSLRALAEASGCSRSHLNRIERGNAVGASIETLCVVFAVLGMRLSVRPYPEGVPLRDAGHARLLARFRGDLPPSIVLRTEVRLRLARDLRAWDGELQAPGGTCKLEAETNLVDLQATERRIALKMADDEVTRVLLLVADTRRNRAVLREFREHLAVRFPLGTREVMKELRAGRLPEQSGIVVR